MLVINKKNQNGQYCEGKDVDMRQSLLERCEAQIHNEAVLRKADRFEFEQLIKFGAFMHASAERESDPRRIKACKLVLQEKALAFARFREPLKYVLQTKMALSDDPIVFIEDVLDVYEQLREGRMQPGEVLAMAATAIVENCPADRRDAVVEKAIAEYEKAAELRSLLGDGPDVLLVILMVMAGKEADQAAGEIRDLLQEMKEKYRLDSNAARYIAMVLVLSDNPVDNKVADLFRLFDACDKTGHATSADNLMVVYTIFADSKYDFGELVTAISEVDEWLKKKKGYGSFGIGGHGRSLFAALLAFEDIDADCTVVAPDGASAMADVPDEANTMADVPDEASAMADVLVKRPVPILTMLILVFVIASKAR